MPLMGLAVGMLPGCGPQILVTSLYISGAAPLSAQLANAIQTMAMHYSQLLLWHQRHWWRRSIPLFLRCSSATATISYSRYNVLANT